MLFAKITQLRVSERGTRDGIGKKPSEQGSLHSHTSAGAGLGGEKGLAASRNASSVWPWSVHYLGFFLELGSRITP